MDLSDALGGKSIKVPFYKEAYIQGLLTPESPATQSNTVRLRGYRRGNQPDPRPETSFKKRVHWRLYMEYLYAGDLHQLIYYHTIRRKPSPEPFIWWTMKCLASALKQMEDLSRARSNAHPEQDETIVMLDMKPCNIFLDGAGGPEFEVYPRPVIGDFGSAHLTYADQVANRAKRLMILCTPGFTAPEFHVKDPRPRVKKPDDNDDEEEADNENKDVEMDDAELLEYNEMDDEDVENEEAVNASLDSWSNVWQLGKTIEAMMRLETRPNDRDYEDPDARQSKIKTHPPRFKAAPEFCYSAELLELIWGCQVFEPECRPAPEDILYAIDMDAPPHIHGMDVWGSEDWVAEQCKNLGTLTDHQKRGMKANIFKRAQASKLWFLHDFKDCYLAEQYQDLDLDLPPQCELTWMPQKFRNRICQKLGAEEPELAEEPNNKRPRTDEAITVTQTRKKRRIA
ncbi:unnamed protein product [Aureobasidium vineae]|uniref:non-specific serine/threonine protein kinase n=1 Tax=Aureobasidium vineae TaxID=2773715 RepID=A0A9N8P5E1_9PEZI|nr:unnamed protein product [Aureobasidium vineae]